MSGYTIAEIFVWLLLAAILGFILGWLVRTMRYESEHGAAEGIASQAPPPNAVALSGASEVESAASTPSATPSATAPAKKAASKKTAKKARAKKAPAKKASAKKASAAKAPATNAPAKKAPATNAPAKKVAVAKKASAAKSPAKKAAAKKAPAKKASAAKVAVAAKAPATKSPAKKVAVASKAPAKKAPAKKAPAKKASAAKKAVALGRFPGSAKPLSGGRAPSADYTIKGNEDSMIFHTPDSPSYGQTIAETWFKTEAAAVAAGFRKPLNASKS